MGLMMAFSRDLMSNSIASNGDVLNMTDFKSQNHFKSFLTAVFWWGRGLNILNTLAALCVIPWVFYRFRRSFWENNRPIFWILGVNSVLSTFAILIATISFSQGDRFHLVTLPLSLVSLGVIYFFRFRN